MENETKSNLSNITAASQRALYTVAEFVQLPEFNFWTNSSIRHLIFNSRSRFASNGDLIPGNGLVEAGAIIKIGKRVLIDATKFRQWQMQHVVTS